MPATRKFSFFRFCAAAVVGWGVTTVLLEPLTQKKEVVIDSSAQASKVFESAGRIMLFGEDHSSPAGFQTLVNLMPNLSKAHVSTLVTEMPAWLNPIFKILQDGVRDNNDSALDVYETLNTRLSIAGITMAGGDERMRNFAEIITAAAKQGISIVGADPRSGDMAFMIRVNIATEQYDAANPASKIKLENVLFSRDRKYSDNIKKILSQQDSSERIAVVIGVGHLCTQEPQTRLVSYLGQAHIRLTSIALEDRMLKSDTVWGCQGPPTIGFAAPVRTDRQSNGAANGEKQERKPPVMAKTL